MKDNNSPPEFPLRFLKWFCKPTYHRDIEGDLLELYDRRVEKVGLKKAKWLLLKDVLLLFRPGIIRSFPIKTRFMLKENLKIAGRQLFKNKVFTAINLAGLTVGMTAILLILVWAQNEWSFDRYYPNADQLYRVICHWEGKGEHLTIPSIPIRLRDMASKEIPEAEEFFIMRPETLEKPLIKTDAGEVFEEEELAYISDNWIAEFGYEVVSGSLSGYRANKFGLALTEERARRFFGDMDPIGSTVEMYSTNYTVELVLKDNPSNSSFQQKVFLPLNSYWPNRLTYEEEIRSSNYQFIAFFKAPATIDRKKVEDKFSRILSQIDQNKPTSCSVFALTEMRFQEGITNDVFQHQTKATVNIFALIGLIILLVAILNYINLSTATISKRIQEIGIRKVVGANFSNIFSQMVTESAIISVLGFVLALLAVYSLMPLLNQYIGQALRLDLKNGYIWALFASVLGLAMLVASLYPAFLHAGLKPIQLVGQKGAIAKGGALRKILVVSQFTAAIVVLIGTVTIYQQLHFIQKKDVGYDRAQVMSIKLKYTAGDNYGKNLDNFKLLKGELEQIPEIESIAITDGNVTNIDNRNSGTLKWEGKPEDQSVIVSQLRADEDLISVFDLQLKGGRWFSSDNSSDRNNIIVNESAVKRLGIPEPVVGRWSSFQGREGQIIGVVKDFIFTDFHQSIEPLVIWHHGGRGSIIQAKLEPGGLNETLSRVEHKFKQFFPNKPFEYTFLDQDFQQMHLADIKASVLLRIFTGIIIFVSCLGLLGLTIFDAQKRRKEIAIRKVLGANVLNILEQLSRHYLLLVGMAFLLAVPVAMYFIRRWLENFAYHINVSMWIFLIPGVLVVLIAVMTMSFHSLKAAIVNPIHALRQ
ncbi:MAG: ABC transporter permease [Lewinella sp.]|nr:ABC transporter permease [Lewinella sp.]